MLTDTWVFHVAWAICEKCDSGQLGLWHFQHGVSCWTTGLLLRFLVSGRPHNLSKLHTPQWLRFRPAAIVESCCRVESGSFMSTPHHGAVSMYVAARLPSPLCWKRAGRGEGNSDSRTVSYVSDGVPWNSPHTQYFRKLYISLPFLSLVRLYNLLGTLISILENSLEGGKLWISKAVD